ncbi:UNVERIFIED_CONTAM: protein ULTRAPETALA 1 [Sesamum calycinum]|uniref:Protein ULTRAPETALA 1 n=1 Tax=Sesamum calycinum TaxID=2727403 RepID=A0AAW2JBK0_9LAMI
MFTTEELAGFHGTIQNTHEFVEIDCGCTNPRYGDTLGKFRAMSMEDLRLIASARKIVREDCSLTLYVAVNLSPVEFARHAGKTNAHNNWMSQIWVFTRDGYKVSLRRTCLLKHHRHTFQRPLRQVTHRDEFVRCSRCDKQRRFSLRTREACRIYHHALVNNNWKCSDMPDRSFTCNDAEERESRKIVTVKRALNTL